MFVNSIGKRTSEKKGREMESKRRTKLMIRWSIVTGGLIALFWAIWYLVAGQVPEAQTIRITPGWILTLPFSASRWWDILIGPIWSVILIFLFTGKKTRENEELTSGLALGLIVGLPFGLTYGLVFGLTFGLPFGLTYGLVFGLTFGLAFGLIVGLAYGPAYGPPFGLVFGLIVGLTFGLAFGLAYGLAYGLVSGLACGLVGLIVGLTFGLTFGLAFGLTYGLAYGLVGLFKLLFSARYWQEAGNWLLAKS